MQEALAVAEGRPTVRDRSAAALAMRKSEWVILAFLAYAAVVSFLLPVAARVRYQLCWVNVPLFCAVALVAHLDSQKPRPALSVVRDWLPLALVILAYREMGWFAAPHAGSVLESHWVVWDRVVLRGGGKAAIEALGPLLPSVLEIAYSLVYTLAPFSVALLYLNGRRKSVDQFLFVFVLAVLVCYAQFPFWPSQPPRVVFFGQDFPAYDTIFRRFNLWMLGSCGIHTSVFPSAHVAGAFGAAFGLRQAMPSRRWAFRLLTVIAVLIAIATVYGRYHYLADASAGLVMAVFAAAIAHRREPVDAGTGRRPYPDSSTEWADAR